MIVSLFLDTDITVRLALVEVTSRDSTRVPGSLYAKGCSGMSKGTLKRVPIITFPTCQTCKRTEVHTQLQVTTAV